MKDMKMMKKSATRLVAILGFVGPMAFGTSGCSSMSAALGMEKSSPDEFAVVTKAPLIIPPDFSLRPPQPGAKRPNEPIPSEVASEALFKTAGHEISDREPSEGERAMVDLAGADETDGSIRTIVEEDYAESVAPKKSTLSRLNIFSSDDKEAAPPTVAGSAAKEADQANQRYLERDKRKTFAERVFFWRDDKEEEGKDAEADEVEESTVEAAPTESVESQDLDAEESESESSD